MPEHQTSVRIRYSETDQMGTVYNSRVLEWFEVARTELMREMQVTYAVMEERGVFLPLVEAYVQYLGRGRYDHELALCCSVKMEGKARVRFEVTIDNRTTDKPLAAGYTIHAVTNADGKVIRPPQWLVDMISE